MKNQLTKTTTKYASERNLFVSLVDLTDYDGNITLTITTQEEVDNGGDGGFIYAQDSNGGFYFCGNIGMSQDIKEELPAYIFNEKHLREVIDFIASETNK